jgi:hypothetical protein
MIRTAFAILLMALSLVPQSAPKEPIRVVPGAAPAVKPVYRELKPGEQRVEALLQRIECPTGRPVTFILKAKDRVLKYQAPRLTAVDYIAYTPNFRGPVSCGGRTPAEPVILTWKTIEKTDTVVAVEFLPRK